MNLKAEAFNMKVKVIKDLAEEKHDESQNRMIAPYAIGNTFTKAGTYILNIGTTTFLETIIMNLLSYTYCYFLEQKLYEDYRAAKAADPSAEEPDLIMQN